MNLLCFMHPETQIELKHEEKEDSSQNINDGSYISYGFEESPKAAN